MRRLWPPSHRALVLFLSLLALNEHVSACVDVLFVIDNKTLEVSRSRALQVAKQLPEDQKIRKWVVLSREDRYVPRVLRNNAELQSVLSTIHGDYDRFLDIATGEISRRTATFQPFVILLFSETPVNQTMTNMWRKMSLAPALHIFRIGSLQRKQRMLSEDQETDFEKLILCGHNKTNPFDTESSKFSGGNEIRRAPTSTHRPLTSTRDPFVRRLTFYDASRTLLEEKPIKKTSSAPVNNKYTITRTFRKMTTKQMSSTRTTTSRPWSTTTRKPSSTSKFDVKKYSQRTTTTRAPFTTTRRPESSIRWTPTSRKSTTTSKPRTTTRSSPRWSTSSTTRPRWTTPSSKDEDLPKWIIRKKTTTTTRAPLTTSTRKSTTTTTTRYSTTTTRPRWTTFPHTTSKHQSFPTWVFNNNRVTTRTPYTTTTRRPSTTTRQTTIWRWSPSTTAQPRWTTLPRTSFPSTTPRIKPASTFWHSTGFSTTPVPPPASTIDLPPKKLENLELEEFRSGKNFKVRSRSVHFAMTEKPPVSSTMNMMRLFSTTRPTTTSPKTQVPYSCTADIFFLVDLSQGTGDKSQQYLDIAASAISTLPISQEAVRVGLISYSGPGRTQVRVYLDKHNDKEKLIEEMFLMERHGGTTRTADAIRYATKIFEGMAHPARRSVKKVLVVFTDGYSQDNPKEAARVARAKGVQLIAVAVKDKLAPPDAQQLADIGGHPTNVFVSPNGRELREKILGTQCRL